MTEEERRIREEAWDEGYEAAETDMAFMDERKNPYALV